MGLDTDHGLPKTTVDKLKQMNSTTLCYTY